MDVHIVPGVQARGVAEAHQKDLHHQEEYGCKCMTYWIDEERETVFCLIEAPQKEAVEEMHRKAHGLIPNKIIEVSSSVVKSFLGRIYDPQEAEITAEGLKVFSESSYRILLVTQTNDPVLLRYNLGAEKADMLLKEHNAILRKNLAACGGQEVEHVGSGFVVSFGSAAKAVSCAMAIQKDMPVKNAALLGFKLSLNAGEPVEKNSSGLFGDTLQLASHMCSAAKYLQVAMASSVKQLVANDYFEKGKVRFLTLSPQDEILLQSLYIKLEENWQSPEFDVDDFCKVMAMSKSQLYRKAIALTGMAPKQLLKEFRLEKAKELMKKQFYSISQITFDSGFTSPSYFTKCFKKKFGLLPMTYMELLQ